MRRALTRYGYVVHASPGGGDGLIKAERERPAVIRCDLRMPAMDGHTFLRRLAATNSTASVVVVSGDAQMDDVIDVMRQGAIDFLKKPWSPPELAAAVARAVELHASRSKVEEPKVEGKKPEEKKSPLSLGERVGGEGARTAPAQAVPAAAVQAAAVPVPAPAKKASAFDHVLAELQRGEIAIPSIPATVGELRGLLSNPEAPIERVVSLVEKDQALYTRVLRLGKSLQYTAHGPADLRNIVSRVGFKGLRMTVETVWLNGCFQIRDTRFVGDTTQLFRFSVARALAMRTLSDRAKEDAGVVYRAGLFADVAVSFLLRALVEAKGTEVPEREQAIAFAVKHHEALGPKVLEAWGHEDVVIAIARRHHTEGPRGARDLLWASFIVGTSMARALTQTDDLTALPSWPGDGLLESARAALAIDQKEIDERLEKVRVEVEMSLNVMG